MQGKGSDTMARFFIKTWSLTISHAKQIGKEEEFQDGVCLTFDSPAAHLAIESIMCWWLGRKLNGLTSRNAGRDQNES